MMEAVIAYNTDAALELQDAVISFLKETKGTEFVEEWLEKYRSVYAMEEGSKSTSEAKGELVNDSVGALFTTEKGLKRFCDWLIDTENVTDTEKKGILNKLKSALDSIISFFKKYITTPMNSATKTVMEMEEAKAEKLRSLVLDTLDNVSKVFAEGNVESDVTQYETINIRNSLNVVEDYPKIVENIEIVSNEDAEYNREYNTFVKVSDITPDIICDKCNAPNLPMIIRYDTLYLETRNNGVFPGNYHGLGADVMKDIFNIISNPDMILKQSNGRFVVISYDDRIKGSEGMISLKINSVKNIEDQFLYYNVVVTAFDLKKRYFKNIFLKQGAEIKYKKEDLEQVNPQLHEWLSIINSESSNRRISQNDEIVNNSERNSLEVTDKAYMDAVKNGDIETAQRMVDEAAKRAGYTVRALRGTNNFRRTKPKSSMDFFATDSEETARTYANNPTLRTLDSVAPKPTKKELGDYRDEVIKIVNETIDDLSHFVKDDPDYSSNFASAIERKNKLLAEYASVLNESKFFDFAEDIRMELDDIYFSVKNAVFHKTENDQSSLHESFQKLDELHEKYSQAMNSVIQPRYRNSGIHNLYANTDGHLVVDAKGAIWTKITADNLPGSELWTTETIAEYARKAGYTGVTINNVMDSNDGPVTPATVYIFFNRKAQVKSADAVTYDRLGRVIPLSKRFNENKRDIRYSVEVTDENLSSDTDENYAYSYENLPPDAFYKDGRIYDYDFLVSQENMPIITNMPSLSEVKYNGRIVPDHITELGLKNVEKVGGEKHGNVYLLKNRYTKKSLQISKDSITHGLGGGYSMFAVRTNARLGSVIGDICQNAIPINGLPNTHNVKGTYTMVSLIQAKFKENSEWLVARVTVEQQNGKVMGIEALDVTHAVSGVFTPIKDAETIKSAESSASQGPHSGDYVERAHKLSATISIADLLTIVNRTHQEFLSDDVIEKLGTVRANEKKGLFSLEVTDHTIIQSMLEKLDESIIDSKEQKGALKEYKERNAQILKNNDLLKQARAEKRRLEKRYKNDASAKTEINALNEKIKKLAATNNRQYRRLAELESTKAIRDLVRQTTKSAVTKQRQKDAERLATYKDKNKAREIREKIKKIKSSLQNAMLHPTDNSYIPAPLMRSIVDVCELIEDNSPLYKKDGSVNKAQQARELTRQKLRDLVNDYKNIEKDGDPLISEEYDETIQSYLNELRDNFDSRPLSDISYPELQIFYDNLRAIVETLQDAKKIIGMSEAANITDLFWITLLSREFFSLFRVLYRQYEYVILTLQRALKIFNEV